MRPVLTFWTCHLCWLSEYLLGPSETWKENVCSSTRRISTINLLFILFWKAEFSEASCKKKITKRRLQMRIQYMHRHRQNQHPHSLRAKKLHKLLHCYLWYFDFLVFCYVKSIAKQNSHQVRLDSAPGLYIIVIRIVLLRCCIQISNCLPVVFMG